MKKFIAIAFVAMLAVIISSSMTAQNANYTAKCAMCHGADGSGKAAMKVEPFSAKKTEAERIAAIKNGASGAGPMKMTGFAGKLTDAEITALAKDIAKMAK